MCSEYSAVAGASAHRRNLLVCGSDVHAFLTKVPKYPQGTTPDPLTGESLPVTLGHEFVGNFPQLGACS